jgi:hypothetical protein
MTPSQVVRHFTKTRKEICLWAISNAKGQYIASYRAYTAQEAINKAIRDDAATAATFRRSQPASLKAIDLTATKMAV